MLTRRLFLSLLPAGAAAAASGKKPLRGIFPIMQTPFTASDKLDTAALAKEGRFLERCGTHGMVWPQLASEYSTLSVSERMAGMEALLSEGKDLRPAIVIGVQAPDARQAVEYARAATRWGADGLIALPPAGVEDEAALFRYFRTIGEASDKPLFLQAVGKMPVEFVVRLNQEIPTLGYIKDEAGPVLERFEEFKKRAPGLSAFTGGHGKTMYEEMLRGFSGSMPAAGFVDLYAQSWDLYHEGRKRESAEMLARALLFVEEIEAHGFAAMKYILHARGIFPEWRTRLAGQKPIDATTQRALRELLDQVRPWLKA